MLPSLSICSLMHRSDAPEHHRTPSPPKLVAGMSSGDPTTSHSVLWMRGSKGHPLVPSARQTDASSASPACPAVFCGHRRLIAGASDVASSLALMTPLTNPLGHRQRAPPLVKPQPALGLTGISYCVTDVWPPHVRFDPSQPS